MGLPLQFKTPTALEYFSALVADDTSLPLLEAAVSVALDDAPKLDVQGVLADIDKLGERLRRRIPADAGALQRLRLLNTYFFHELGFAGNVNDYHDRRNSYLHEVLHTRRGIPITLALLYIEIAAQAGLAAQGVSFPGHFLVRLRLPRGEVLIDPFSGHSLSRSALAERLTPHSPVNLDATDEDALLVVMLRPASPREVIARLLRNLKAVHHADHDWHRLCAVLQRMLVLLPQSFEDRRELAQAWAAAGEPGRAAAEMTLYLQQRPQCDDAPALQRQLQAWRQAAGYFSR
jgi:regulator of sirC expression with transglutaminase-like and TPR domain